MSKLNINMKIMSIQIDGFIVPILCFGDEITIGMGKNTHTVHWKRAGNKNKRRVKKFITSRFNVRPRG